MTSAELQAFAYDHVCQSTDPGNAGYMALSFAAASAASAGTPLEGFTVDEIAKLFWDEHALISRNVRRNRGRS